jgi:hypothetical protein
LVTPLDSPVNLRDEPDWIRVGVRAWIEAKAGT